MELALDGRHRLLGKTDACLLDFRDDAYDRVLLLPSHGLGIASDGFEGVEEGSIPVVLEDTPAALGRCRVHDADLLVRVPAKGLTTYPDLTVICGPWERDATDLLAVTNPKLIVEVLSRNTEKYDRSEKLEHYKHLPSLQQHVLVSLPDRGVKVWTHDGDEGWTAVLVGEGEVAKLVAVGARLAVCELYDAAAEPTG